MQSEIEPPPGENEMNIKKLGKFWKTQNFRLVTGDLWWLSLISYHLQPGLDSAKTGLSGWATFFHCSNVAYNQNYKNDSYHLQSQKRDLQQNQTLISLGQSSTSTYYQPFWMPAITRNRKSSCHHSQSQHRDLQQNWIPLSLGQSLTCLQPSWMTVITKYNRNDCHGSSIGDCWLWLTSQMVDNTIADQRWSQNTKCFQTRISNFFNVPFNLILGWFNLISHKV